MGFLEAAQWVLLLVLLICVVGGLVALIHLWTELKAMQKSTHSIQYIDPLQAAANAERAASAAPSPEKQAELFNDDLGNLALS